MNFLKKKCKLILEDGSEFEGYSFGYEKCVAGEVVFNTGMVGYPENLTDPSYRGQIITLTYPLVGNYGVPSDEREDGLLKNFESERIYLEGVIVADYSDDYSHHSAVKSLSEWLVEQKVPAISGIDTRALTKVLREKGTMLGKIVFDGDDIELENPNIRNLVSEVSISEPITYKRGKKKVALVDCGTKNNIIRELLNRDITVVRVPWDHDFSELDVDGVLLSNGPGDPAMYPEIVENVKKAMDKNMPMLGICLGSQMLAIAAGAKTYKLKYGHRGHNQPCMEMGTRKCHITSQNHGYAIDSKSLPQDWREWFYNNNDETCEGLLHISKPFFGSQFHPEATPGPDDTNYIFDIFLRALK